MTSAAAVPAQRVLELLDTSNDDGPDFSCIATALREARALVGRTPQTGEPDPQLVGHEATWSGALIYLIFAEQIGSCFHPVDLGDIPRPRNPLRSALQWFADLSTVEADALNGIRNRLAHDFTLRKAGEHPITYELHTSYPVPLVEAPVERYFRVSLTGVAVACEVVASVVANMATRGEIACHYRGGIDGVHKQFWMHVSG